MSRDVLNQALRYKLLWQILRWIKSIGMSGMSGVTLLLLAIGLYLGAVMPQQERFVKLTQDVADEQARQKSAPLKPVVDTRSTEARLRLFYDFFPSQEKAPALLKTIYRAARDEAISLADGEYKYNNGKAGGIKMYQIDLPVRGSYIQIRKFIVKVLNAIPSVALDEVNFKRELVGSGELEARLRFIIYLGAG